MQMFLTTAGVSCISVLLLLVMIWVRSPHPFITRYVSSLHSLTYLGYPSLLFVPVETNALSDYIRQSPPSSTANNLSTPSMTNSRGHSYNLRSMSTEKSLSRSLEIGSPPRLVWDAPMQGQDCHCLFSPRRPALVKKRLS